MNTSIIVEPILPHISQVDYVIGFIVLFVIVTTLGWIIQGKLLGGLLGIVTITISLIMQIIPLYLAVICRFIVLVEFGLIFVRNTPKGNKETPQKPQEITGAFDKSQFKRGKQ